METDIALVISGVVAGAVQIVKLSGVNRKWGMFWALGLSCVGCFLYGVSFEPAFERVLIWKYFTAIVVVAGAAVGIHSSAKNTKEMVTGTGPGADTVSTGRFTGPGTGAVILLALALTSTSCATTATDPTPGDQGTARQQTAEVIERLTLGVKIVDSATDAIRTSSISPALKIEIGCDILKAVGFDTPPATVTTNCGSIPSRATAPLHLAVKTAEDLTSCASRQNTIAVALQALRPVWEKLERSTVLALQILGGSLKFAIQPITITCGGVA